MCHVCILSVCALYQATQTLNAERTTSHERSGKLRYDSMSHPPSVVYVNVFTALTVNVL